MGGDVGIYLPGKKSAVRGLRGCLVEVVDAHLLNCGRRSVYAWLDRILEPVRVDRQKIVLSAGGARLCVVRRSFMMLMIVVSGVTKAPWQIWQMMVVHHDYLRRKRILHMYSHRAYRWRSSRTVHAICSYDHKETQKVVD